jgi:N-methylhydantoinase A/oxoprolinase/acetone carboxylase beta subunit
VEAIDALTVDELSELFAGLEQAVTEELQVQGVGAEEISLQRSMSGMYTGQGFANELDLGGWPINAELIEDWKKRFDALYDRLYGYSAPEMGVTLATLTVSGTGPRSALHLPSVEAGGSEPPEEAIGARGQLHREDGSAIESNFYRREALRSGNEVPGPAVIEDDMTTVFLPDDCVARIDNYGNVRITV